MTDKPWLAHYPEGVPAEIDLDRYHSLVDVFEQSCERFRDHTAYMNFGTRMSFAELERQSRHFAAWLQSRGLKPGDRIALMMPNILQYPVTLFGALRAGLVVVNTNPMYTARELRHQLIDAGARAIVVVENFAHVLEKVRDEVPVEHIITTRVGDLLDFPKGLVVNFMLKYVKKAIPAFSLPGAVSLKTALSEGSRRALDAPSIGVEDLAFLQYTGGTTGVAKGAMLTHRNLIANMLQSKAWLDPIGLEEGAEVVITALPLYHVFALTANCLVYLMIGGTSVLITNPRDAEAFVKELKDTPYTTMTGVNTLFNTLLHTPGFADQDFSKVKGFLAGGTALQRSVSDKWREVTGHRIVEGYGLTETSPVACINPADLDEFTGCIGLPVPSTECAIASEDGEFLPQGEPGELMVRGPQVMKGYWQRPEDTDEVLTSDGWLRTGDVAQMEENGFFRIVDRKKDMILVSGFNVYPNEIEDVIAMHPKVLEVAAVGIPDEKSGEAVKVCVVAGDASLTKEEILAHCKENLTGYKRPRVIEFYDELPKSNVGKILRRELREDAKA